MISRSTDIRAALRSRQRGFLLSPYRFSSSSGGGGGPGSPEKGFILSAVAGTLDSYRYDSANTSSPTWAADFGQTIGIGLFGSKMTNPGDTGVLATKTINQFSVSDTFTIKCSNWNSTGDTGDFDMEFLNSSGGVVAAVRSRYLSAFALAMSYGSSLTSLVEAGRVGTFPIIDGPLTFTASSMKWTPAAGASDNNQSAWTFNADFSGVTSVRFSNVRAISNSGSGAFGAAYATVKRS